MSDILSGSDRAEDLTPAQILELFASTSSDEEIVSALQSAGTHLLEGSRGTGKTTLLRVAAERLRQDEGRNRVPVFISFSRYLATYSPKGRVQKGYHPFQNWVFAKIKQGIEQAGRSTTDPAVESGDVPLGRYIQRLETHYQDEDVADPSTNAALLGVSEQALLDFARVDQVQAVTLAQMDRLGLNEVVLLLDEAAQSFAEDLQPEFFQLIKHLRHARIAIKVATYPHATNYGPDFDVGHDAIVLRVERPIETEEGMAFLEEFLSKRYGTTDFGAALRNSPVARQLMIKASAGNPRWLIHLLSGVRASGARPTITTTDALAAVKKFPDHTLWPYVKSLGNRLRSRRRHVDTALQLVQVFISDLQDTNRGAHPGGGRPSVCYVAVSLHKTVPFRIHAALRILQYAGLIYTRGPKKITARETAEMFLLHPAIQIKENTLYSSESTPPASAFVQALTTPPQNRFKEYTRNSPRLLEFHEAEAVEAGHCSSCGADLSASARFCSNCGTPVEQESLFSELRAASSDDLELTAGVKARLVTDGRFPTVGSILDADREDLEQVYMIGPQRSLIIRYAAEEFVSG